MGERNVLAGVWQNGDMWEMETARKWNMSVARVAREGNKNPNRLKKWSDQRSKPVSTKASFYVIILYKVQRKCVAQLS